MIHTARALGMKIMLGCMVESAIAATAAAHLSPLVDWADIDGPFLTADDPFTGVQYERGKLVLSGRARARRARARGRYEARRYAVLAPDRFAHDAKTAHGVIAYGSDETVAVVDPSCAGQRVSRCRLPYPAERRADRRTRRRRRSRYGPTALLIGTAPQGRCAAGRVARRDISLRSTRGLEIVSGLHDMLGDDPEFSAPRSAPGRRIWDVRKPPAVPLFSGAVYDVAAPTLLMVGNDCAVGKMTVALELCRAAERAGRTRRLRADRADRHHDRRLGHLDRSRDRRLRARRDRIARALRGRIASRISSSSKAKAAINHPAYAPVTLALMYGAAPDALVLVCDPTRERIAGLRNPDACATAS